METYSKACGVVTTRQGRGSYDTDTEERVFDIDGHELNVRSNLHAQPFFIGVFTLMTDPPCHFREHAIYIWSSK